MPSSHSVIIVYGVILHGVWAAALFFDPDVRGVTAIWELSTWAPAPYTKFVLATVAVLAAVALFLKELPRTALLLPQQLILLLSAWGALQAMYLSAYADGVLRPRAFLIADQMPAVLLAVAHTIAIINAGNEPKWKAGRFH